MSKANSLNVKYVSVALLAVIFSWVLHEFAHWVAGTMLGYDMGMSFNKTFPVNGRYSSPGQYQLISAAGPVITLLEASGVFWRMRQRKTRMLYPFLFACFYMRLLATVMSFIKLNDEARISKFLGLGTWTLPLIMNLLLLFLLYNTSRRYKFTLRFNAENAGLILLFSSVIIFADQYFNLRIL